MLGLNLHRVATIWQGIAGPVNLYQASHYLPERLRPLLLPLLLFGFNSAILPLFILLPTAQQLLVDDYVSNYFGWLTTRLFIPDEDAIVQRAVSAWALSMPFAKSSRSWTTNFSGHVLHNPRFLPQFRTEMFWHQGVPCWYSGSDRLIALTRNPDFLQQFVRDLVKEHGEPEVQERFLPKNIIHNGYHLSAWLSSPCPKRGLDSVVLDTKQEIITSLGHFFEFSKAEFRVRSFGMLFHGSPGTGKSCTAHALADHFGLRLYVISSLQSFTDAEFFRLMENIQEKSLVLFEDIDASEVTHSRTGEVSGPSKTLSFSGLLSGLDEITSKKGVVVVMTTNHPDKLDEALTRPGRIQKKIKFERASSNAAEELFNSLPWPQRSSSHSTGDIKNLAAQFAKKIPHLTVSTADIEDYLMERIFDVDAAVHDADEWVAGLTGGTAEQKRYA